MVPDYDLTANVRADTSCALRALAHPLRKQILDLVLERAATVTELAVSLAKPKSTVSYHVDVLVEAGLLRVVRTRRVRAIEERFYGRTGRTIVVSGASHDGDHNFLTEAVREVKSGDLRATLRHARIPDERASEFFDRVIALAEEFTTLPRGGDVVFGFVAGVYPTDQPILAEPS